MADELKASPVKREWALKLANALRTGREYANQLDIPYLGGAGDVFLGKAPEGFERVAYDEPLTSGAGWTTRLRPETVDMGFLVADAAPAAKTLVNALRKGTEAASTSALRKITGNAAATPSRVIDEIQQMNLMPSATAWHGSPYLFNKFDPAKIGAGEGNQVYGAGAGYVAQARPVAEGYRKRLSSIGDPYTYEYAGEQILDPMLYAGKMPTDPTSHAVRLAYHQGPATARSVAKEGLKASKAGEPYAMEMGGADYYQKMLDVAKGIKKSDIKAQQGFLYKGDVPDEIIPKMLDWDVEVPDELRQNLSQKAMEQWGSGVTGTSGEKLYKEIAKNFEWAGSQNPMVDASNWLQQQGVTGIKYFDAGSRSKSAGTQNLIPFDPEHFKIEEINDLPLSAWEAKGVFK